VKTRALEAQKALGRGVVVYLYQQRHALRNDSSQCRASHTPLKNKDRYKDVYKDIDKEDIEFMLECVNKPHYSVDILLNFINYKYGWECKKFEEDFVYQDIFTDTYKRSIGLIKYRGYKTIGSIELTSKTVLFGGYKTRSCAIVVDKLLGGEKYETTTKGYDIYRNDKPFSYVAIKHIE
jgi:hypothetical protein